ncbi:MAG: hypothetical protein H6741_19990 [Alphaproteobacteria bacterium]|nr:hypothetical protein [Alphaproteobacteria bacterium]
MPDADLLLRRLREDEQHLARLVHLATEDLLERPVSELIEPEWLAERLVQGLRTSASDDRTKEWIRDQVVALRKVAERESGNLRDRVSPELVHAARDLLRRPYAPDPTIVRAILDHKAVRDLIRELLQTTLTEYAAKVQLPKGATEAIKGSRLGRSRLAQLANAATVAARVVGSEVERQLEGRIQEFVDGAISRAVDTSVAHFCAPEHAADIGDWRADSVDTALGFPVSTWARELAKLDPDRLIDDLAELLRALVNSEGFARQVQGLLTEMVRQGGDRSARDFLAGSGLEEGWRPHLEELMSERARAFVATDAFADWLQDLVEG